VDSLHRPLRIDPNVVRGAARTALRLTPGLPPGSRWVLHTRIKAAVARSLVKPHHSAPGGTHNYHTFRFRR
jgi:hypothetical protein